MEVSFHPRKTLHSTEASPLDAGDKATAKAMSAAYKHAMLQTFCIPVQGIEEPDAQNPSLALGPEPPDPVQGWEQWSIDIQDMIRLCETSEAIGRVQNTYRSQLRTVSKRRPELYVTIGAAIESRRLALTNQSAGADDSAPLIVAKAVEPSHA